MSHYSVIAQVSQQLQTTLWDSFRTDNEITQYVSGPENIVFSNPTDAHKNASHKLSIWLYQITENEYVKNQPLLRQRRSANGNGGGDGTGRVPLQFPPMALNLFYLITPFASFDDSAASQTADHLLLGKTMQTLYDNAIIYLHSDVPGQEIGEELRVIFCRLTLEELTRIWEALQEPYRLSVCYQIRVTRIDSARALSQAPVVDRQAEFE